MRTGVIKHVSAVGFAFARLDDRGQGLPREGYIAATAMEAIGNPGRDTRVSFDVAAERDKPGKFRAKNVVIVD
jgi:hypothetical protein